MKMSKRRGRAGRSRLRSVFAVVGTAVLIASMVGLRRRSPGRAPTRSGLFSESVDIARPPEEVFAFVADPLNDVQWTSAVEEVRKTSEGPPSVGTMYEATFRLLGRHFDAAFEIAEYDAPNRILAVGPPSSSPSGPLQLTGVRSVEAVPGGTRLTIKVEGETGGFFWLLPDRLVAVPARRRLKVILDNVKSILEARS